MRKLLMILSFCGLGLTIIPSFFVYIKIIGFTDHLILMLIGTVIWFGSAPAWMNRTKKL